MDRAVPNLWSLSGPVDYDRVRELQLALLERRARGEIPDTVLFLEHLPVVTQGRGLQFTGDSARPRHMPVPTGVSVVASERGGDLTYHGPGQLVVYPIVKLDGTGLGPERDIAQWIRKLEGWLIGVCEQFELQARREEGATGVWVGDQKIASIGIAVRKWVSYHGVAINGVNDLTAFRAFNPCGFDPEVMTRLADRTKLEPARWRSDVERAFIRAMGLTQAPQAMELDAALAAALA